MSTPRAQPSFFYVHAPQQAHNTDGPSIKPGLPPSNTHTAGVGPGCLRLERGQGGDLSDEAKVNAAVNVTDEDLDEGLRQSLRKPLLCPVLEVEDAGVVGSLCTCASRDSRTRAVC